MKFCSTKEDLLKVVQIVQSAINSKSTLPILSNILIETTETGTTLTATDFDIGIISTSPIKALVPGAITVPAKKFLDITRELPDGEQISISVKKNNLVNIECANTVLKIMGLAKEEFPQLPEFKDKDSMPLSQ